MAAARVKYIVELEIDPAESGKHPDEWFWTDACPEPGDEVTVLRVSEAEE